MITPPPPLLRLCRCGDFNFDATHNFGDWRQKPSRPPRPNRDASSSDDEQYAGPVRQPPPALENDVLASALPGYLDAWAALRPEEPGHTFDGATNPHVADPQECMRYDRVMVRGARPVEITMLGQRPQGMEGAEEDGEEAVVVPSDHYGLCTVVEFGRG